MDEMMDTICDLKCTLTNLIAGEMSKDLHLIDTEELGMIADILKDLSEVERNSREACYFKTVTKAMKEGRVKYTMNDEVVVKSI